MVVSMDEKVNKWKVLGYVVITWFVFSILAGIMIAFGFMADRPDDSYKSYDAIAVVWSWASLIFGMFLAFRFKNVLEIVYGIIIMFVVFIPPVGIFIAMAYFGGEYYELEKRKIGIK
jgi:phosphate/sulfate permease